MYSVVPVSVAGLLPRDWRFWTVLSALAVGTAAAAFAVKRYVSGVFCRASVVVLAATAAATLPA